MTALHSATGSNGLAGALDVTVRIGVFFDGTGNNRINSQIGADCQAMSEIYNGAHIKECSGRHSDPNSSYGNDLTNIAKLADLYRHQAVAKDDGQGLKVYQGIYVSGVGTTSGGRDSRVSGQGFGRGNTGVLAKVGRCIKKIDGVLTAFAGHNPHHVIAAVEIDLFGFSRGAAAARHLANEVLKQSRGALGPVLKHGRLPLASGFTWASVRLKVIGLFDTVAAVGGISDFGNVRDAMNARVNLFLPPGCAQQVLHLVAGDEHRRNFALNRVAPDWSREIILPGSHSDIGGGYHPQSVEVVSLTRPRRCLVGANTPYDTTEAWLQTHAELDTLDAQRWLDADDPDASLSVECFERIAQRGPGLKSVVASVRLERRVFGHLSRVHLRVMHTLACDEGVPFNALPDTADLSLPPELCEVAVKLVAYARGQGEGLTPEELGMLYRRYIHCSAHWNASIGRRGALLDSLYLHAPAIEGRRHYLNISQPGYPL